jgi:integrase
MRVFRRRGEGRQSAAPATTQPGAWSPRLLRAVEGGYLRALTLGHPLLDAYLSFAGARVRPNTWLAIGFDLKVFFDVVGKAPAAVTTADVLRFIEAQRTARSGSRVVRLEDGEAGLSPRTIKRRLATVSGFYAYLVARGDAGVHANPVPRGLPTRRTRGRRELSGVPLLRTPRTLPRILTPEEVDALHGALRTHRDRALVEAMVLGGLRRCEALGLRINDLNPGERRVFVAESKGGHQRLVPISDRFFASLAAYFEQERPDTRSDAVFVVLKGPRRGLPLTAAGLDEIIDGARDRAGLRQVTCHQLRHTCLTRLREAGMALEALQAQAGHRSIESTRVYLHLANGWLVDEYVRAVQAIEDAAAGDMR